MIYKMLSLVSGLPVGGGMRNRDPLQQDELTEGNLPQRPIPDF